MRITDVPRALGRRSTRIAVAAMMILSVFASAGGASMSEAVADTVATPPLSGSEPPSSAQPSSGSHGSGSQGSASQGSSSQGASAQSSSQNAAGAGMPLESTMLMYQSAIAAARTIADAFNAHQSKNTLVLTQADLNGFASLRIALVQGAVLKTQLESTSTRIDALCPAPPLVGSSGPRRHFAPRFGFGPLNVGSATASAVGAWITSIAQISSVTESVASRSGALSDQALMILVAGSIHNSQVFIPSMYPPKSLATAQSTQLGTMLNDLETQRAALLQTASVDTKRTPCLPTTAVGKRVNDQVAAASSAVDAFEAGLFNGAASSGASQFTSGATYQQMLSADLLSQSFGNINDYQVAVIRAGDSGGSNLTKQSLFQGTRQYYSGGAGAYYLLFNADSGALVCAGYAYGYHGFIAAGDVGTNGLQVPSPGASPSPVGAMYHPDDKLPSVVDQRSSDCH